MECLCSANCYNKDFCKGRLFDHISGSHLFLLVLALAAFFYVIIIIVKTIVRVVFFPRGERENQLTQLR